MPVFSSCELVFSCLPRHRQRGGEHPAGEAQQSQAQPCPAANTPGGGKNVQDSSLAQHRVWIAHTCELRPQGLGQLPASHLEESRCQQGLLSCQLSERCFLFVTRGLKASQPPGSWLQHSVVPIWLKVWGLRGLDSVPLRAVLLANTSVLRSQGRKSSGC